MKPPSHVEGGFRHDPKLLIIVLISIPLLVVAAASSLKAVVAAFAIGAFVAALIYRKPVALGLIFLAVPFSWSGLAQVEIGPLDVKLTYILTLAACSYLIYLLANRQLTLHFDRAYLWLIAFLLFAAVSVFYSIDIKWSVKEFIQLGLFALTALVAANMISTPKDIKWFVAAMIIVCAAMSLFGLATIGSSNHFTSDGDDIKRALMGFSDANLGANYILLGFAACLVYMFGSDDGVMRKISSICLPIISIGLLASFSRAGWIVAVLMVAIVSVILGKWRSGVKALLVVGAAATIIGGPTVVHRATEIASVKESSTVSHLYYWKTATNLALTHPLVGIGAGAFPRYFEIYGGTSKVPEARVLGSTAWAGTERGNPQPAHNVVLQMWSEIGTPGLLALLLAVASVWHRLLRQASKLTEDQNTRLAMIALFAGSFAVLFHNLSITNLTDHFWIVLGVGVAAIRLAGKDSAPS